jgi:hypothetical protein
VIEKRERKDKKTAALKSTSRALLTSAGREISLSDSKVSPDDPEKQNEIEALISETQKLDDLEVDYDQSLGFKTGDLGMVRVRSYRCTVRKDPSTIKKRLILSQIICMDLDSYNRKIEEAGSFIRFNHHPNIATLYSYWVTAPESDSYYKSINMLYEEATVGDLTRCLVLNPLKPSKTTVSKYICDLAKGMFISNFRSWHASSKRCSSRSHQNI